jgi:Predicted redox protein, regulator of disulfide bond formation
MSTTITEPRVRPKSFSYRTTVGEVTGRTATLCGEGKPPIWVSSPPEFKGEAGHWTPEDFFVAALDVCLMLTFIGLAEKKGLVFDSYESSAEGLLEWDQQSYRFTKVVLTPVIAVRDEAVTAAARQIMERAHQTCLVANSVTCEVV